MRHAARTDANHAEISEALRSVGFGVRYVKWPADLVIAKFGRMAFVEVKTEEGHLTSDQRRLIDDGFPVFVVQTVADVERLMRSWGR